MTATQADGLRTTTSVLEVSLPEQRVDGNRPSPSYLRHVSVRGAVWIAAVFNALVGLAVVLAGYVLVLVAGSYGFVDQVNTVASDLGTGSGYHLSELQLLAVWTGIVIAWTVAMTAVAGLAVVILNAVLQVRGGIRIEVADRPADGVDVGGVVRHHVERARERLASAAHTVAAHARDDQPAGD